MKKKIEDINLDTWFTIREMQVSPKHFTKTNTPLTRESKIWILEKLHGRFSTVVMDKSDILKCPSFEDPREAVFYELTWG